MHFIKPISVLTLLGVEVQERKFLMDLSEGRKTDGIKKFNSRRSWGLNPGLWYSQVIRNGKRARRIFSWWALVFKSLRNCRRMLLHYNFCQME